MKTVYVVNELCKLENTEYNNCHGVFFTKEKADKKALEIFEIAKADIADAEYNEELEVWNDVSLVSVVVDKCEIEEEQDTFTFYNLSEPDLDYTLENNFTESERKLMFKHFSKQDMIEVLRRKLEINFCEEIEPVIRYRILNNAQEKECIKESN